MGEKVALNILLNLFPFGRRPLFLGCSQEVFFCVGGKRNQEQGRRACQEDEDEGADQQQQRHLQRGRQQPPATKTVYSSLPRCWRSRLSKFFAFFDQHRDILLSAMDVGGGRRSRGAGSATRSSDDPLLGFIMCRDLFGAWRRSRLSRDLSFRWTTTVQHSIRACCTATKMCRRSNSSVDFLCGIIPTRGGGIDGAGFAPAGQLGRRHIGGGDARGGGEDAFDETQQRQPRQPPTSVEIRQLRTSRAADNA